MVASWYGPGFHGKRTSSGEVFDMNSLTCAHKTMPFGTKLMLKNVNGSEPVEVTVNDRGPFVSGRDLDLSKEAARRLGILQEGTGKVRYRVTGRDPRYIRRIDEGAALAQRSGPFTIQVAALVEPENAEHLREGLALSKRDVYMYVKWINGKKFHRVRVGKFDTREQARAQATSLADEGYDAMVMPYEEPM